MANNCVTNKMDISSIINRIYIFVSCFECLVAFAFLTIAVVYRHRCFNFLTLLACNTALATFLFSCDNVAAAVYMLIWDQQSVPNIDSLCSFRAYIHHSTIAAIHHSLILQAMGKYFNIKGINLLNTRRRKVFIVLIQWIVDLTFTLPIFLTGNMPKLSADNVCFVSLSRLDLVFYLVAISFIFSNVTLAIIYRRLVSYVREVSSRVNGNQQRQTHRDLSMVRRIVLLNFQLVLVGIAILIFIILGAIRADLTPPKWMRFLLVLSNLGVCLMLIILFWITPNLHQSLLEYLNKTRRFVQMNTNRVIPVTQTGRF